MHTPIIAANWKLSMNLSKAQMFFSEWGTRGIPPGDCSNIFLMPAFLIGGFASYLFATGRLFGGQNVHTYDKGAFTGENSASVLAEMGGSYCLVGHSERRRYFGESNHEIAKKLELCQRHNITPILCVGESAQERRFGLADVVIEHQIVQGMKEAIPGMDVLIAYEPVWAIGTGNAASLDNIGKSVATIRSVIRQRLSASGTVKVLYGGSVDEHNAHDIVEVDGVNGLLVGSASLTASSLLAISHAAVEASAVAA